MTKCCLECLHLRAAEWMRPEFHCALQNEITPDLFEPNGCKDFSYEPGVDMPEFEEYSEWLKGLSNG